MIMVISINLSIIQQKCKVTGFLGKLVPHLNDDR
jgi:hypothetical protein